MSNKNCQEKMSLALKSNLNGCNRFKQRKWRESAMNNATIEYAFKTIGTWFIRIIKYKCVM